jgi:hypothetical protein
VQIYLLDDSKLVIEAGGRPSPAFVGQPGKFAMNGTSTVIMREPRPVPAADWRPAAMRRSVAE